MSTHKNIDKICGMILAVTLLVTVAAMFAGQSGIVPAMASPAGYENRLFDTEWVHTIQIVMDDWENFLETCENEEYAACSVIIDNETYRNVGIRAKGNTSLTSVSAMDSDRYSFKIEFDCYESGETYHGLDKVSLNNIIQDNTYMKDYLTYRMMGEYGVAAPLCSYAFLSVNGEDRGLYLAVEGVEESFLARNYGNDYGELYKPDSMSMGGGRGNGDGFGEEEREAFFGQEGTDGQRRGPGEADGEWQPPSDRMPEEGAFPDMPPEEREKAFWDMPLEEGEKAFPDMQPEEGEKAFPDMPPTKGNMRMGSDDVALIYSDDSHDSYRNIFENAKTDVTDADKDRLIAALKVLGEGREPAQAVEVEAVIRYFVVHNFVCNFDSYTGSLLHNYYLYEKDGKLSMIPWDYNLAFGGFMGGSDATEMVNYPIDSPVSGDTTKNRPMLAWIFSDETYTALYHQYFAEFPDDFFESGRLQELIASARELISPYVERDPTKFCTFEEFEAGADTLEAFCLLRAQSIQGQLDGSVPATDEQQRQNRELLVDASHLNLTTMGKMEAGRGAGSKIRKG